MYKFLGKVVPKIKFDTTPFKSFLDTILPTQHSLKIVTWNVNGIRSFRNTPGLIESYMEKENPDIFCLQETKISSDFEQEFEYTFDGYKPYYNCCSAKKGYSGTVCYSKKKPIAIDRNIGSPEFDNEGRTLILEYHSFILFNLYVPNSGDKLKRIEERQKLWDDILYEKVKQLQSKNKPIIICGDLNVAILNIDVYDHKKTFNKTAGNTQIEKDGMTKLLGLDLFDSYRKLYPEKVQFTFFGARGKGLTGWRLDYFLLSNILADNLIDVVVRDNVTGSDHVPVVLLLKDIDMSEDINIDSSYTHKSSEEISKIDEDKKNSTTDDNNGTVVDMIDGSAEGDSKTSNDSSHDLSIEMNMSAVTEPNNSTTASTLSPGIFDRVAQDMKDIMTDDFSTPKKTTRRRTKKDVPPSSSTPPMTTRSMRTRAMAKKDKDTNIDAVGNPNQNNNIGDTNTTDIIGGTVANDFPGDENIKKPRKRKSPKADEEKKKK